MPYNFLPMTAFTLFYIIDTAKGKKMTITNEEKAKLIKEFSVNEKDTGSPEVQIAILTTRIQNLTAHMKDNHKDFHSRRGLIAMVGKRRRHLDYLKSKNEQAYQDIIKKLNIRR